MEIDVHPRDSSTQRQSIAHAYRHTIGHAHSSNTQEVKVITLTLYPVRT